MLVYLAAAALHSGRGLRGGFVVGAENAGATAAPDGANERYRELFGDEAKQVEREIKAQAKVEFAAKILKTLLLPPALHQRAPMPR